jgi:sialic acid synthase SpsE
MRYLPEIIAEIGVNYYDIADQRGLDPVQAAKEMVKIAKGAGVNVVKFQTYKAEKLAAQNSPAYWDLSEEPTASQRELFSKYDKLSYKDFANIAEFCNSIGAEFMSTPFDVESAIAVNGFVKRHKIASADITNVELLSLVGSFEKPVILSTGGATREEVERAVEILRAKGSQDITLLHCVLNYPTVNNKANLWKIEAIKRAFGNVGVGYSDHTKFGVSILEAAWLLGAEVIEKHFTLDKNLRGNDHYHAASPEDFRELLVHMQQTLQAIGNERDIWYDVSEEKSRENARRGVYLKRDVKAGELLKMEDAIFLRPQGSGIDPMEWTDRVRRRETYRQNQKKGEHVR